MARPLCQNDPQLPAGPTACHPTTMEPRATLKCMLVAALAAAALAEAAAQSPRAPQPLQRVREAVVRGPAINGDLSVVGIQLVRSVAPRTDLDVELQLPDRDPAPARACVTARSRDGRFVYVGNYEGQAGLGPLRLAAALEAPSRQYLQRLARSELALLASAGACSEPVAAVPTFVLVDPLPSAAGAAEQLRVLLNAPEERIGIVVAPSEGALKGAPELPCLPESGSEVVAYSFACLLALPASSTVLLELRRHRPGNKPLIERVRLRLRPA